MNHIISYQLIYIIFKPFLLILSDIDLGVSVLHPFTQQPIPIFASSLRAFEENVDSHLGIPSASEVDLEFAIQHGLNHQSVTEGDEHINSEQVGD